MKTKHVLSFLAISFGLVGQANATTEICGNGIDDDGNGLTDEGCYPTMTTGVCESPLSCGDTGMVSWSTGSLHYDLPPDISPAVPYGPGIGFRRFYTSMYTPGSNPTSVNHTPLGANWQHTYMTWLYAFTDGGGTKRITLHTSSGRDVYYTDAGACGIFECYTPQPGEHVMSLYVDTTNTLYYVQLLTGETLKYNSVGQLVEIWDTMPTPNKVLITWTSTSNGNVSTVTDASGERQLLFNYTNNLLTSINFRTKNASGAWVTQHTTTYDYTNGVTRDATSQWFVPQSSTEWTELLQGTGISNPTNLWLCQETSGSLADSIGTSALTATGTVSYRQTVSGWSRLAVAIADGATSFFSSSSTWCNPKTTKCSGFAIASIARPSCTICPTCSSCTVSRDIFSIGDGNGARVWTNRTSTFSGGHGSTSWTTGELWDSTNTATAGSLGGFSTSNISPWVVSADPVSDFTTLRQGSASGTPTWATGTSASGAFKLGYISYGSNASSFLYAAGWSGTALTSAQQTVLNNRIMNGAGLSRVTIGSQLAQEYTYDGNGYLTKIADGAGNQVVAFGYSSTTSGQVDLITTSRGTVGFEYGPTRTGCSGASLTMLYFNKGNTTSCSADADCGTGYLCGGKTGTGTTGMCFLAGRCLTTSTVNGESVITNVAPIGPGGTCSGACTDVMAYNWSSTSNLLNVTGREDPLSNYTSATYNGNGLPTQVGYGDTNADPTDGGTNRTVYYFYDSTFPGRIAEIRRPSDLSSSSSSCSSTSTTGCQRTIFCYGSSCSASCNNDNQLCTIENDGFTYDSSGSVVSYASKITYVHDSKGRIAEIDGAVSGLKTLFDYYAGGTGSFSDNFVSDSKMYTTSTTYLQPQITSYDFWGHPITVEGPDGNYTCDTYDSNRGYLSSRKRALDGSSTCGGTNLTTSYARDSWLRLTQVVRPDLSNVVYTYDSSGRLYETQRADDTRIASDHQIFSYTADSQISEVDTYNSSNTLTAKQPYTYFASRRLQEVVNPADTSKFTGLVYDSAGKVTEVDGGGSLSKTVNHYDSAAGRDNRVTSEERYKTSSTSDTWSLLYAWAGSQSQVTDPDSKVTASTRDDLGRIVKISSPDLAGPMIRVYDAASRLTTVVEDLGGGGNQLTHSFSYDSLARPLSDDYAGRCATTGTNHPWIQRSYDALPAGVGCPTGMVNCTSGAVSNAVGRLAYVETVLMCSSTYSSTDGSLDQFTYYAYDRAGRLIEEYIADDASRVVDTQYQYTANGVLSQIVLSGTGLDGAGVVWTYGSSGNNSDTDRVTAISRKNPDGSQTTITDTVQWNPFGPWQQYNWETTIGGFTARNRVARNLGYRISTVYGAEANGTANAQVAISEDAMGRVTSRVYTPTLTGLSDSYFTYDEQSRVLCEATTSGTCPTSGSTLKNSHDQATPFTAAGDWKEILRPIAGSTGGVTNNFNSSGATYGTSHQVTDVNQSDGTPTFGHTAYAYNAYGSRSYDDNTSTLTNDRRDYTYDARHNVTNVRGQYYSGSAWHYYDVASSYDHKNRRVFKSFYDETTAKTATWFFYYDIQDRLTEVSYTQDASVPLTYSVFQLFWLGDKLLLYWEADFSGGGASATSKRYVASDETERPIQLWNWPPSGDATRVWAINPTAWGFDSNILGPDVYQPILFAGQYRDLETEALENDGSTTHRPGVVVNWFRTYDPFLGAYLQLDPLVEETWSSYLYLDSSPVGADDKSGLMINLGQFGAGPLIVGHGLNVRTGVLGETDCPPGDEGCTGQPACTSGDGCLPPPTPGNPDDCLGVISEALCAIDLCIPCARGDAAQAAPKYWCSDQPCHATYSGHDDGDKSLCTSLKVSSTTGYDGKLSACTTAASQCEADAGKIAFCHVPASLIATCFKENYCSPFTGHPGG